MVDFDSESLWAIVALILECGTVLETNNPADIGFDATEEFEDAND